MKVESEGPRQTIPAASTPVAVTTLGPAPTPEPGTIPGTAASVPKAVSISSGKLRARITDALDREDLQQVKSLCKEAMVTDAALAEFCGIVFFIQPEPSQAAARAAGSVDLGIEESKSCKAKGHHLTRIRKATLTAQHLPKVFVRRSRWPAMNRNRAVPKTTAWRSGYVEIV